MQSCRIIRGLLGLVIIITWMLVLPQIGFSQKSSSANMTSITDNWEGKLAA